MRVVMVILEYLPITGGAQRQIAALAPAMQRAGIEVHVITRRGAGLPAEEMLDGVAVHRLAAPGPRAVASAVFTAAALRRLRALRPDLVHAYSLFSPATIGVAAKRLLGVPLVVKLLRGGRAGDVERLLGKPLAGLRVAALRRDVDRFVSISGEIDAELASLGVEADRRAAIPNGVDVERFRPATDAERGALRASLGLPRGPLAIFTGRLVQEKRVDVLLDAWRAVHGRLPDARLVLVGEGPQGDVWRRAAGPGVHFAGALGDVAPWLRAADAFVLPSETEGLSNALLEAMATGLPVVATRVGGARDVVADRRSGRLVPAADAAALADALVGVLDPARAAESAALGRAAREAMIEGHALDAVAGRLTALYRELLRTARAPRPSSRLAPSERSEGAPR